MCDADSLRLNHQQLVTEIATLLAANAERSDANALTLNQELQRRLEQIRARIVMLLKLVRARYSRNEQILVRRQKTRKKKDGVSENYSISGAVLRGGTFRFKGNLYFRDEDGRSCPNNEDYNRRCATEMFPTDFDMRSKHVWTVFDKKSVVMGIKQQLLDHARYQKQTVKVSSNSRIRKGIDLHMQTLSSLLSNVDSSFSIDWNQISALDVQHRHSPYSCEAMWLVYLHPNLNRNEWTTLEDDALLVAAKDNKMRNWQAIADSVPHRSDYQCFVRVQTTLRFYIEPSNNVKWTQQENERLCKVVELNTSNGVTNWSQVVEHFPDRSKSTLIGRYLYVLHPSISHAPFTPKEDIMLYAAFQEYKGKFNCFPRTLFPNRSLAQLRTRYNNVLAQRNKTDSWSVEDDKKLMAFVTTNGTSQWLNCAKHLGNHTRTSCRTRFLVIKRFLEQHPNATIDDLPRRKSNKNAQVTAENWGQRLLEWTENPDSLSDTEPKAKRPKRLTGYVGTLRGMDVHIYEYFKYAYNLRLQSPAAPIALPKDEINLHIVVNALRFRPPEIQTKIKKLVKSVFLPQQLNRCYSKMLHQLPPLLPLCKDSQPMLLPPNWSTMMGFRAICILSVHCRNHSEYVSSKNRTIDYDESHAEVQLFRQRLRTLFYRTTLLSRLETSVFKQLPAVLTQSPRPGVEYTPSENEKRMENSSSRRSTRNSKIKSELDEKSPKRESPSD